MEVKNIIFKKKVNFFLVLDNNYIPQKFPLMISTMESNSKYKRYSNDIKLKRKRERKTDLKRGLNDLLSTVKSSEMNYSEYETELSPKNNLKKFKNGNLKDLITDTADTLISRENETLDQNEISRFSLQELAPMTDIMTSRERAYYRGEIQKLTLKLKEKTLTNDRLNTANNDMIQKLRIQKTQLNKLIESNSEICEDLDFLKNENHK